MIYGLIFYGLRKEDQLKHFYLELNPKNFLIINSHSPTIFINPSILGLQKYL